MRMSRVPMCEGFSGDWEVLNWIVFEKTAANRCEVVFASEDVRIVVLYFLQVVNIKFTVYSIR